MAFSPDNRWLVTGSGSVIDSYATARLWDLRAKDLAASPVILRGSHQRKPDVVPFEPAGLPFGPAISAALAFSPNAHWLVTVSGGDTAQLWDLSAKDLAGSPMVLRGHEHIVTAVAFSPDNRWLVTCSYYDGTARLWNLTVRDLAASSVVLRGSHEDKVKAMAFSPNAHWLAAGTDDGSVRLWPLQVNDLVELAHVTVGRNFTAEEWKLYFAGEPYRKTFADLPGP